MTLSQHPWCGQTLESEVFPEVSYLLIRVLGEGGMATAFLAKRIQGETATPCVLKITDPALVIANPERAQLIVSKEAVALGRLNEQVPPTPYVVRLLDTGASELRHSNEVVLAVPWLALEFVHGGPLGVTLEERVENCLNSTGAGFNVARARHLIQCLEQGLKAIHSVGVVHRDLTPGNILCCGNAEDEMGKISDFGIARPEGMDKTFAAVVLGTPGYAAPEQFLGQQENITSRTDVFSFGALVYFVLTGRPLFDANNVMAAVALARSPERLSLSSSGSLEPGLAGASELLAELDEAIAAATAWEAHERPASIALAAMPILRALARAQRISRSKHAGTMPAHEHTAQNRSIVWAPRSIASGSRQIRYPAWNSDGTCVALSDLQVEYHTGINWVNASSLCPDTRRPRFVVPLGPDSWLFGGDDGLLTVHREGRSYPVEGSAPRLSYVLGAGDPADLCSLVALTSDGEYLLTSLVSHRWVKPYRLPANYRVHAIARLDSTSFVISGDRMDNGQGWLAIFQPLFFNFDQLELRGGSAVALFSSYREGLHQERPMFGCTTGGTLLLLKAGELHEYRFDERGKAIALEPEDGYQISPATQRFRTVNHDGESVCWLASDHALSRIEIIDGAVVSSLDSVLQLPHHYGALRSIFSKPGFCLALASDGAVLEGRGRLTSRSFPPTS